MREKRKPKDYQVWLALATACFIAGMAYLYATEPPEHRGTVTVTTGSGLGAFDLMQAINCRDQEELETVWGIEPALAERIVACRDTLGPFELPEDLLRLPGVTEEQVAALWNRIKQEDNP